jgi:sugar/nucleoside kinase (ribokinase family)
MDDAGGEILHKLKLARFDPDDIQVDDVHPTGSVNVQLDKSVDTNLTSSQTWPMII